MDRWRESRIACTVLLCLPVAACMHQQAQQAPERAPAPAPAVVAPTPSQQPSPPPVQAQTAPQPLPAPPAATSVPHTVPPPTSPATPAPVAPTAQAPSKEKPAPAAKSPPKPAAPAAAPSAQPTLDLASLEQRLRDTHAIGIMTKLSLKNQVDDLLADFKKFHQGAASTTLAQLRQSYELLLLKVVSVLQNGDPQLASAVSGSREAIWSLLSDPKKFAQLSWRQQESPCHGAFRFYC